VQANEPPQARGWIGPAGRTLYVQRDDDPAAERAQRLAADQRREGERQAGRAFSVAQALLACGLI